MRMNTDNLMYDTNEHYDLIFTPADVVCSEFGPEDDVKAETDVDDDDWVSGDNVTW